MINVAVAGQQRPGTAGAFSCFLISLATARVNCFSLMVVADRAGIDAAMAGIDDDQRLAAPGSLRRLLGGGAAAAPEAPVPPCRPFARSNFLAAAWSAGAIDGDRRCTATRRRFELGAELGVGNRAQVDSSRNGSPLSARHELRPRHLRGPIRSRTTRDVPALNRP